MLDAEATLRQYLKERFSNYEDDLRPTDPLATVIDSLGLFEIVSFVEKEFCLAIPEESFSPELFSSIANILRTIRSFGHLP